MLVTLGVIAAFFAGVPVAMAAFLGGALLLVTRAIKAHKVYQEIDGSLLLMFAGLFVVVAAAEKVLLTPEVIVSVQAFHFANVYVLTALQYHQQRAGSIGAQTIRAWTGRSTPHLARDCYERDLGRQPYTGRLGGEPHRCRTRPRRRHPHFILGLLPRRNSDHNRDSCDWRMVAKLNFWVHSFRQNRS